MRICAAAVLTELFYCAISARRGRNEGRVRLAVGPASPSQCLRRLAVSRTGVECVWLERGYLCCAQVGDRGPRRDGRRECKDSGQDSEEGGDEEGHGGSTPDKAADQRGNTRDNEDGQTGGQQLLAGVLWFMYGRRDVEAGCARWGGDGGAWCRTVGPSARWG